MLILILIIVLLAAIYGVSIILDFRLHRYPLWTPFAIAILIICVIALSRLTFFDLSFRNGGRRSLMIYAPGERRGEDKKSPAHGGKAGQDGSWGLRSCYRDPLNASNPEITSKSSSSMLLWRNWWKLPGGGTAGTSAGLEVRQAGPLMQSFRVKPAWLNAAGFRPIHEALVYCRIDVTNRLAFNFAVQNVQHAMLSGVTHTGYWLQQLRPLPEVSRIRDRWLIAEHAAQVKRTTRGMVFKLSPQRRVHQDGRIGPHSAAKLDATLRLRASAQRNRQPIRVPRRASALAQGQSDHTPRCSRLCRLHARTRRSSPPRS